MEELKNNHNCNSRKMSGSLREALGQQRCLLVCQTVTVNEENKSRILLTQTVSGFQEAFQPADPWKDICTYNKYMSVSSYATFSRVGCCI